MEIIFKDKIKYILNKYNISIDINEIEKRYSEKHRFFHTIEHINFILNKIYKLYDNKDINNTEKDILVISCIFHDIIYIIGNNNNEKLSSEFLLSLSPELNDIIKTSINIINDTANHKSSNKLSNIFIDLDMSIISDSSFPELLKYEKQIYLENQKYGFSTYKKNRLDFLKHILLHTKYGHNNQVNIIKLIEYIENYTPKIGIYAGSFNPFHNGHKNIMEKAEKMFDKVIIAIGINPEKNQDTDYLINLKNNTNLLNKKLNKEVNYYTGLITDYIKEKEEHENIDITLIRGLRDGFDLVYENRQMQYIKDIYPNIKIVYIPSDIEFSHISSKSLRYLKSYDEKLIEKYTL
jgi:pantetheine-phosphate adenylyltransferase